MYFVQISTFYVCYLTFILQDQVLLILRTILHGFK